MAALAIDHVLVAMPRGGEEAARGFYRDLLGLPEIAKPSDMAGRGGCWFDLGPQQLHLGVDVDFRPSTKAHIALATGDLAALRSRFVAAGVATNDGVQVAGRTRFFTQDPFGNRLEFVEDDA